MNRPESRAVSAAQNNAIERTWPFPSRDKGVQMRGRSLRVASCGRERAATPLIASVRPTEDDTVDG